MGLWNVWTALLTGLILGGSLGMLLTALLTMSSRDESSRSDLDERTSENPDPGALRGKDATTPLEAIERPPEPGVPLRFH